MRMMVDLETLDVTSRSVVLSLGYVIANEHDIIEEFYTTLQLDEQLRNPVNPRTVSEGTLKWWLNQSDKALKALLETPRYGTNSELAALMKMKAATCDEIWAKPAGFDLPMLRDLLGQDIWRYSKERDMTTVIRLVDPKYILQQKFDGVAHNALDDAKNQMLYLRELLQTLDEKLHPRDDML